MKLASYEAARLSRGKKHICQTCDTPFYDLMRSPIVCPSCGAHFKTQIAIVKPSFEPKNRWRQDFAPRPKLVPEAAEAVDDSIVAEMPDDDIATDEVKSQPEPDDDRVPEEVQDDGDIAGLLDVDKAKDE
jgi:uncharacterized protein (TIGR02300 family)